MTATYTDLQNACVRELFNRSDLTTEIQAAIQSAIAHYQKQKFWFSENLTTFSTTNLQASDVLPTNFGFIDGLTIIYSTYPVRMERRDWKTMQELYVNTTVLVGPPTDYAIYEDKFWWWPTPNNAYTITVYENTQNAAPTNGTDTSNWTDVFAAEELIRSRAVGDIFCHVLKREENLQELAILGGQPYLSKREMIAHQNLMAFTTQKISSGRIKPIYF